MKAINLHPVVRPTAWGGFGSKSWLLMLLLILFCVADEGQAQCSTVDKVLHPGERVDYDLYFKWGILMPKAGLATLSVQDDCYQSEPAWRYRLLFRTKGVIEKVYKMRDTMDCYFSRREARLLFSTKHSDEKDYYQIDDLTFSYPAADCVEVHSHRYTPTRTKIDTLLSDAPCVFDMLGATMYLRSISWDQLNRGDEFPFHVAIGRDMVNARFRYTGQQIVEHGDVKYSTRHFFIDIFDEAFTQSKAAAEVWIGDDANHLPIKIRAKLKIGAAEVYYKEGYNLREPLTCRFEMK